MIKGFNEEKVFYNFYTTPRLGSDMVDGGGPFGLDIHTALEICYLIDFYECDSILETGTNIGDTTEFLAKTFSMLPVKTCEYKRDWYDIARYRLEKYSNVDIYGQSSQEFIFDNRNKSSFPFFFLDAHGKEYWPLKDELSYIERGVVCVHDFNINYPPYKYDYYNKVTCDSKLVKENLKDKVDIFTNNPKGTYAYPSLQRQRLSGRGYFVIGKDNEGFIKNNKFKLLND